jgi:hypothetical protein
MQDAEPPSAAYTHSVYGGWRPIWLDVGWTPARCPPAARAARRAQRSVAFRRSCRFRRRTQHRGTPRTCRATSTNPSMHAEIDPATWSASRHVPTISARCTTKSGTLCSSTSRRSSPDRTSGRRGQRIVARRQAGCSRRLPQCWCRCAAGAIRRRLRTCPPRPANDRPHPIGQRPVLRTARMVHGPCRRGVPGADAPTDEHRAERLLSAAPDRGRTTVPGRPRRIGAHPITVEPDRSYLDTSAFPVTGVHP